MADKNIPIGIKPTGFRQKYAELYDGTHGLAVAIVPGSNIPPIVPDSPLYDAFGRARQSSPETLFDSKQIVDNLPLFFDDQETSGGGTSSTHSTARASSVLAVSGTTAGQRVRQTFRRFNYQPGKSQLVELTAVTGTTAIGNTKRLGYFDSNNGIFFEFTSAGMAVAIRSGISGSPEDTVISQANFNVDKLDGTGASGVNIDLTKSQIFFFDFEWLGVGDVRFGIIVDHLRIYCHYFHNANVNASVYMSTPNLPVRYEINNDGTGAADSIETICTTVISEGGTDTTGVLRTVDRGVTGFTTASNTLLYPVVSMRLKSTHQSITVKLTQLSLICTTTADFRAVIILNPTFANAGVNATYTALANSAIEYNIIRDNTNTLTGGTQISSAYLSQTVQAQSSLNTPTGNVLTLGATIAGVSDVLVLAVQNLSAAIESYFGAINFRELL